MKVLKYAAEVKEESRLYLLKFLAYKNVLTMFILIKVKFERNIFFDVFVF